MEVLASDFTLGGVAAMGAILVTNPLEVVKTRMQLQGELAKKGTYSETYRSIVGALITIGKSEGLKGLQKGLAPAACFQFLHNSVRFGIFTGAISRGWAHNKNGLLSFPISVFWGSIAGASGAFLSSPFFMIKTQLQAQAAKSIAVGYQHKHSGVLNALKNIYLKNGIPGLWQGSFAVTPRAGIGSGVQMGTYEKSKEMLRNYDIITHRMLNSICASILTAPVTTTAITPADVVTTRLYNQPLDKRGHGLIYKGWFDCFRQIYRAEGFQAFYKGFWANYLRNAPHSILVLFLFDQLKFLRQKYVHRYIRRD